MPVMNPMSSAFCRALLGAAFASLLTACGGGGNESGPADSIYLSVTQVHVGSSQACAIGLGPEIHVYGGSPPYALSNALPQGMSLNKATVMNSGDSFVITFINGVCMMDMPITIEDRMGRLAQVKVTNGV